MRKQLPCNDPNDVRWPNDGSASAACKLHVRAGLWAIDTFNANAWPNSAEYLRSSAADFAIGQEVKIDSGQCKDIEDAVRCDGWKAKLQPCVYAQGGGKSAGTVVACRKHIGMREAKCSSDSWPELQGRFQVKVVGAVCKGGLPLATCYLHSKVGIGAKVNLDMLHAMAAVLNQCGDVWVLGGDFNCTPEQLRNTGWLRLVNGHIVQPPSSTCGDRTLDFFVVASGLAHAVKSAHTIGDAVFKQHRPVRLLLRAKPRALLLRTLAAPLKSGPILPHGPPNKEEVELGDRSDTDLGGCMERIEHELSQISGHDVVAATLHAGRSEGPKFKWKQAVANKEMDRAKTTSVSRAWRNTAGWLADARKSASETTKRAAQWKIRWYDHPTPDPARASPPQLQAMETFKWWQRKLEHGMLQSCHWLRVSS